MREVEFEREDIVRFAKRLKIPVPKNLGDLIYSFRYRAALPAQIEAEATAGHAWIVRSAGRSKYKFVLVRDRPIAPNKSLARIKVPDSTPGLIAKYALTDEQALLAKVRYNRLLDIFTGVACYSLQNHLRTTAPAIGQVETDEIYIGVDKSGIHYVFPVQAKGGTDRLGPVQIEQDIAVCASKFPALVCRPVAAQFIADDAIALFELVEDDEGIGIAVERHYELVPADDVTDADLGSYRQRGQVE
jgi:hypothetical protein